MPAYHFTIKKPKDLPFRSFYLCTDSESVSDVASSIAVLIELPAKPYLDRIRDCSDYTKEAAGALNEAEEGVILVPMLVGRDGFPKYVSLINPASARRKLEYFWTMRDSPWGTRGETVTPAQRVYQGKVNLIINGERKGSPCSHCPKVLDSFGVDATCTFGISECKKNLNIKELLHED